MAQHRALTITGAGRLNVLSCDIFIGTPRVDPTKPAPALTGLVTAIWDTGATGSVITQGVVDQLGIAPIGMTMVTAANTQSMSPVYLVDFYLPSGVVMVGLNVTLAALQGIDALIGMDVIGAGDLAITCKNGNTKMSFRTPSSADVDYVKEIDRASQPQHNGRVTTRGGGTRRR